MGDAAAVLVTWVPTWSTGVGVGGSCVGVGGATVSVGGTTVAVGGAGVGVGVSGMAMGVGLGAQPFTAITAIVRQVTKNLASVFIFDLPSR